jgi:lysophospholipase L1-like esterase
VDARQVGIEGLSRYGKAALVTMAYDQRFAIGFISSGEGARLHRRNLGDFMKPDRVRRISLDGREFPSTATRRPAICRSTARAIAVPCRCHQLWGIAGQARASVDLPGAMAAVAAACVSLLDKKDLGTNESRPSRRRLSRRTGVPSAQRRHTTGPNWPTFLTWADRYIHGPPMISQHARWAPQINQPCMNPLFLRGIEHCYKRRRYRRYFRGDSTPGGGKDRLSGAQEELGSNFHGWNAANFGWGGDTTRNVLWRLTNGELDGVNPKIVVIMVGTNNVGKDPPQNDGDARVEDVARGIRAIFDVVREKAPAAKIVLMGITPRNDDGGTAAMPTIDKINNRISTFADGESIVYLNINEKLANDKGKLFEGVTEDGLHLSIKGYQLWADALKPIFTQWLGPPATVDKAPPASGIPVLPGALPNIVPSTDRDWSRGS